MTSHANKDVLSYDPSIRHNKEINQLRTALQNLDWPMQVHLISNKLNLPVSLDLLVNESGVVPPSSLAGNLNHKTIQSFITDPASGAGVNWNEWVSMVRAITLKEKFGIYASKPQEIINEYEDVMSYIGYPPSSSADYHQAKDQIIAKKKEDLIAQVEAKNSVLNEKIQKFMLEINQAKSSKDEALSKVEMLKNELVFIKKQAEESLAESEINKAKELEAAILTCEKEITEKYELKIQSVEKISDQKVNEAIEKISAIKKKYNSENFVTRVEHNALSMENDRERLANRDLSVRLQEEIMEKESLKEMLSANSSRLLVLEQTLRENGLNISDIERAVGDVVTIGESANTSASSAELLEQIEALNCYVEKFRAAAVNQKEINLELAARLEAAEFNLVKLKTEVSKKEKLYKSKQNKQATNKITKIVASSTVLLFVFFASLYAYS